jgi:hypothetical protein
MAAPYFFFSLGPARRGEIIHARTSWRCFGFEFYSLLKEMSGLGQ